MATAATLMGKYSGVRRKYFVVLVAFLAAVNALTFLYHASSAVAFNVLSDITSVSLIAYSTYVLLSVTGRAGASFRFVVWATALVGVSFLANMTVASPIDSVKYLAIYIFYAAGRAMPGRPSAAETSGLYMLAALPLLFMLTGSSKIYPPDSVAYLPNANTASLYFSSVLFALAPLLKSGALILQFLNAALMNKVGPALATIAAITTWLIVPVRRGSYLVATIVAAALVAAVIVAHMLGALDRLVTGSNSIRLIIDLDPATVAAMPYKDLVELTGTKDLSAFFRIIHWANIWNVFTTQGVMTFLFGYGAGQTRYLAYAPLAPHNDYLRILAEYGALNLAVFVAFLYHVLGRIKLMQARVLFIVFLIYMVSENLLDNFTSMALYFAYAGRMAAPELRLVRPRRERLIERDVSDVSPRPA
jgi:hypothetical protein